MITLPKRTRRDVDTHINIVPYIDVMLVLLVIFMMTTPIIEQGIEVDLPSGNSKSVDFSEQEPSIITINRDGEYFINSMTGDKPERLSAGKIAARVQARMQIFPTMKVFVRGDREVAYGAVIALMSFLQKNGVGKIGIVTESSE
ncbi:protein TolR [Bathymodiolus septemdierum thioautotrophic gill symbiont]|uniref:Tol-Pal system protein TolR n=1 Tax=endosymbiont of Bathymodiolus septemdierum str. Myojin knoll TaxID=1303921 RepID=A0A0P0USJ9_9GAMM|nr:protein TolR [Bathymodiolus septemdierum thioautotrophic gill symbiont]BAS68064.1 biopolymer transport protein TolR [endosymbiont of Bathymodiolus septemdierum str. Myojin knoll]